MKVEIKLNYESISNVAYILGSITEVSHSHQNKESKVCFSIAYDLVDIFQNKVKTLKRNQTLFNNAKKHKMTLKYHHAYALEFILKSTKGQIINSEFERSIQNVIDTLNQKLA